LATFLEASVGESLRMRPARSITGIRPTREPAFAVLTGAKFPHSPEPQVPTLVVAADCVREEPLDLLGEGDKKQLQQCETVLRTGLATCFEVGNALFVIREKRLYRATHATFEEYCRERWGIGKSYTWRVIGAAERLKLLPEKAGVPRPANEFQMRPFLKLEPAAFPRAWEEVTKRAKDGKVTPSLARTVVCEFLPKDIKQAPSSAKREQPKWGGKLPLGQVLVLLQEAKCMIEKNQADEAVEVLARIEALLFGPKKP
jgi:hypothetical protein